LVKWGAKKFYTSPLSSASSAINHVLTNPSNERRYHISYKTQPLIRFSHIFQYNTFSSTRERGNKKGHAKECQNIDVLKTDLILNK